MKRFFPIIIGIGLLLGFYFIAKNSTTNDKDYRIIDESLQADFNNLRMLYLQAKISQQQYFDGVKKIAKKENNLFDEVRNHKFDSITESNYWHRSRLKFPSNIKMEVDRIIEATKDSIKN